MTNKLQKLLVALTFVIVIGILLYVLFQNDIIVVGNQVGEELGVIKSGPVEAFAIQGQGGYVEYVPEASPEEMDFPLLSTVHAKLVIPRIHIEGYILEGSDERTLDKGFWHFPSATPFSTKGNVIIIGHRYLKLPPQRDTFYHLDWVKNGDKITLNTDQKVFTYIVREVKIIDSTDVTVLQQTENAQLTLITCHPLWTSRERLVIIADKVQ